MEKFANIDPHSRGFMIRMGDKDYITTEGLLYLMGEMYPEYSVRAEVPTEDEISRLRYMMTIPEDKPMVIMRGVVETDKGTFVDYGTTSPINLTGFVKFSHYPIEMACRRATNRAMRIATGAGTSIDEMDTEIAPNKQVTFKKQETGEAIDSNPASNQSTPEPQIENVESDELSQLINRIDALFENKILTNEEHGAWIARVSKGMTREKYEEAVKKLDARRNEFLESRKEAPQENA